MTDEVSNVDLKVHIKFIKTLLVSLLPCLTGRFHGLLEGPLPTAMKTICLFPHKYGGTIFADGIQRDEFNFTSACLALSSLIHNEPTCFTALQATGWPDAFLESISKELLPSATVR